jgi:hypothetical protein
MVGSNALTWTSVVPLPGKAPSVNWQASHLHHMTSPHLPRQSGVIGSLAEVHLAGESLRHPGPRNVISETACRIARRLSLNYPFPATSEPGGCDVQKLPAPAPDLH